MGFYRKFHMSDQHAFAALSGDFNPIHLDEFLARRLLFGQIVVHGIHILLWALDCFFKEAGGEYHIIELNVKFRSPLFLNKDAFLTVEKKETDRYALNVHSSGKEILEVDFRYSRGGRAEWSGAEISGEGECRRIGEETLASEKGEFPLYLDRAKLAHLFPAIEKKLPAFQVSIYSGPPAWWAWSARAFILSTGN